MNVGCCGAPAASPHPVAGCVFACGCGCKSGWLYAGWACCCGAGPSNLGRFASGCPGRDPPSAEADAPG